MIRRSKYFLYHFRVSSHMSVSGGFAINRITQLQALFYIIRAQRENFSDLLSNLSIGKGYLGGAIGIDIDTCRLGYPNGVAYLYEHLIGHACRYHILCYMAGSIGSTSVYLARVFP